MRAGISSYSLSRAMKAGELDIFQAMTWIKEQGGEHIEIVPFQTLILPDAAAARKLADFAASIGLPISSYTIGANFICDNMVALREEIDRVKRQVDIAHALGVRLMRHDAASRPIPETSVLQFEKDLPGVADACREIADHAKPLGIVTSVENHGFHMQGSERVARLVHAVSRDNFRTTLDIGNVLCVDEDPVTATRNNIGIASMVHIKDFYIRPVSPQLGEGWFRSKHQHMLRGAIIGQGDIRMAEVLSVIKHAGYQGFLSVEFEGMEECKLGSRLGLQAIKTLWEQV